MRDDFRNLAWCDSVIESGVEIERHLDFLITCDQCRERHDAAISSVEIRTVPRISERTLCILFERGRGGLNVLVGGNRIRCRHCLDLLRLTRTHERQYHRRNEESHVLLLGTQSLTSTRARHTQPQSMGANCVIDGRISRPFEFHHSEGSSWIKLPRAMLQLWLCCVSLEF